MDKIIHGKSKKMTGHPRQLFGHFSETIALFAVGAGIAYGSSWFAGRLGIAVSRSSLLEGRWFFRPWGAFPWLDCLGMLIGMVVLPVWWELRCGQRVSDIGFRFPHRWILYLLLIIGTAAVFTQASRPIATLLNPSLSLSAYLFFGIYFLCVAVAEETMFRGVLQRRIRQKLNSFVAIGISTLFFFFWHGLAVSGVECCLRIIGGVMLGILFDRSGSLLPSMLLHWLTNIGQI